MKANTLITTLTLALATAASSRADVMRWDNAQTIPGTEGITPGPGVQLDHRALHFAELSFRDLTNASFQASDLTDAQLSSATLAGADFSQAIIVRTALSNVTAQGFVKEQLYSTVSYQTKDLQGVALDLNDASGWNFDGQNLRRARFNSSTIANASFIGADLDHVDFYAATMSNSNFTDANLANVTFPFGETPGLNLTRVDLRGSIALNRTDVTTTNAILPDGVIEGLALAAGESMRVRNHLGRETIFGQRDAPIAIQIEQGMTLPAGSELHALLDGAPWNSVISFEPGVNVALGGTLKLDFAPDVNVAAQVGRTFRLFDWTGVAPTGAFAIASPHSWDVSKLYTTGEATLVAAVPEPSTTALAIAAFLAAAGVVRQRGRDGFFERR